MFARAIPTANPDGSGAATPTRTGTYGEAYNVPISNKELFTADEGSYFTAISPTAGTGIIGHPAPTTFDEAKPYLVVYNGHATKRLYPQFLHLHETVASVGGTRLQLTVTTDTGNRRSSAGTALVINNVNQASDVSGADVIATAGAVVGTAATASRRLLGNYVFRGTIDIIEDDYLLVFGSPSGVTYGARPATVSSMSKTASPIVLGPGHSLCITQWAASQSTGPTYEVIFAFLLR